VVARGGGEERDAVEEDLELARALADRHAFVRVHWHERELRPEVVQERPVM
jgi:hypothetical protein